MSHVLVKQWCAALGVRPAAFEKALLRPGATTEQLISYCREQVLKQVVAEYCSARNLDYHEYVDAMYEGGLTEDLKDRLIEMHREWNKEKL
jgi:hypothetical protein